MMQTVTMALAFLLPTLPLQEGRERTSFEKLIPEQPLVEISIENPAKLWNELVKSRVGKVIASGSLLELRKAWQASFELQMIQQQLQLWMGLEKRAGMAVFSDLQQVEGSLRIAYMPQPGFGGWVMEVDAALPIREKLQEHLLGGFGESPAVEGAKFQLFGGAAQVFKQKAGHWFFVSPVLTDGKLYFAAWQHPDGAKMLAGTPGPWMALDGLKRVRTLIRRNKMPFMVAVDLRRFMASVQERIREAKESKRFHDEFLQMAKLLALYEAQSIGLALDIKRGRIVQEIRAEVVEGGRFSEFLGSVIPREGRAVDLMAFQAKGTRTSVFVSVDMPKAYAEFTRVFKEGTQEFGGEEMDLEEICEDMFGFSFENDLIGPLDGRVLFFEGERKVKDKKKRTGFCLGLGTKDPTKTSDVILLLLGVSGLEKKKDVQYKGITIHQYDFSFLWSTTQVRYALTDRFFLFAFEEAGYDYLRQVIDNVKAAEESRFRPTGDLKSQLMLVPQESATLVWADTLIVATSLLEEWAYRLDRVKPHPEKDGDDPSSVVLKSLSETLVPLLKQEGLATTLSAIGRDRNGFWIRWIW